MKTARPAISGPCRGGLHFNCVGNVEVGREFVHCQCPVNGCPCRQAQGSSGGPGMTATQQAATHG